MINDLKPNILLPGFRSKVMSIDSEEDIAHGLNLIESGADGAPIHIHPFQKEPFRVIKGELEVYKGNEWFKISEEEEIVIPKGIPHSFRSRSPNSAYFECKIIPKGNFTKILQSFETMIKSGKIRMEAI